MRAPRAVVWTISSRRRTCRLRASALRSALVGIAVALAAGRGFGTASAATFSDTAKDTSRERVAPEPARTADGATFDPAQRAVSSWRREAGEYLALGPHRSSRLLSPGSAQAVARCVKLNNYWCIKRAGWAGEIASDAEGHVAFASAKEGAAVAALLLKRYYVDFGRRTALAVIERWAPAGCGSSQSSGSMSIAGVKASLTQIAGRSGLAGTLRARWLASHARGFSAPVTGSRARIGRSRIPDRVPMPMATPVIALGLDEGSSSLKGQAHAGPITLDALMTRDAHIPSRSMIGLVASPGFRGGRPFPAPSLSSCAGGEARVAAYAAKAAAGLALGPGGDLALFAADGTPTANLALMMANMAKVEIGPDGVAPALIDAGIIDAFKPGRNP